MNNDRNNAGKRAKVSAMLFELKGLRQLVEEDIQVMESSVWNGTATTDVTDNTASQNLIEKFDTYYYELAAFCDIHNLSLSPNSALSTSVTNQTNTCNNLSQFQLPKRKFPTFSGVATEWQGLIKK